MKSNLLSPLSPLLSFGTLTIATPPPLYSQLQSRDLEQENHQHHLTHGTVPESPVETKIKVPGHSSAFYGPVAKEKQIFDIEFLEVAPTPIPVNHLIFVLLRGAIPSPKRKALNLTPEQLAKANISITLSAILEDGSQTEPISYTVPLRTVQFAGEEHLAIRNYPGQYVDHLTLDFDYNDILVDGRIPGTFIQTGTWTFEIVARLQDGTCLFAFELTQWLERGLLS